MTMNIDDRLHDLRPDTATLEHEWPTAERDAVLRSVLADQGPAGRSRFVARHRPLRRIAVPLAAAAVAALITGVLVAVLPGSADTDDEVAPLGPRYTAPTLVDTPIAGPGQYAYRATDIYKFRNGRLVATGDISEQWKSTDGTRWERTVQRATGAHSCLRFPHAQPASFSDPDRAFIAKLPTDADALRTYLRAHVSGSTSRDEAVFVAIGDLLGTAEGLTSTRLRAAMVSVLSRTGRVAVHTGAVDPTGRASVRADFVDEQNRPGEITSYFFARDTYRLTSAAKGRSTATPGAIVSQSYDAPGSTLGNLSSAAHSWAVVSTDEKVVDALPKDVARCPAA